MMTCSFFQLACSSWPISRCFRPVHIYMNHVSWCGVFPISTMKGQSARYDTLCDTFNDYCTACIG
jgi:hypothetical protein